MNSRLRCILVHGTYSNSSAWDRKRSDLTEKLGMLESGGVLLGRFSWSGSNTLMARADAARRLSELLRVEATEHPDSRFLLVGHSHGGTVAMRAIADVPECQRAGVVCLSTPFFHVRLRSTAALVWIRAGLTAILASLSWFLLSRLVQSMSDWRSAHLPGWLLQFQSWSWKSMLRLHVGRLAGFLYTCLFVFYTAIPCFLVSQLWTDGPPRAQLRVRARWDGVSPQHVRTLCLWYGPDEAFWLLRWIRGASEWLHSLVSAAVRYIMPSGAIVAALTILGLGVMRIDIWLDASTGQPRWPGVATLAEILLFLGCTIVVVPLLLWTVAALISICSLFVVGSGSLWDHFWLDIHTQRTPQIEETFIRSRELVLPGKLLANLAIVTFPFTSQSLIHSRIYEDPETSKEITTWYKTMVSGSLT